MEMSKRIFYLQGTSPLTPLAEACLALTPKVSLPNPHKLYLEIAGTQKLFGGEAAMLFRAETVCAFHQGPLRRVLTDRPEWAQAFLRESDHFLPPDESQAALLRLSLDRLKFCGDPTAMEDETKEREALIAFMKRVGMRSIGDFARLPISATIRRFGKLGASLQEWVTGKREWLPPPFIPEERIKEVIDAEEVTSLEGLLFFLRQTLVRVEPRLVGRNALATKLQLTFRLESKETLVKVLSLSDPMYEAQPMLRLLMDFLNNFTWESPLEQLELEITDTVPNTKGQLSLFDKSENRLADIGQYVARLRARFGNQKVGFAELQQSYVPERSWQLVWPPKLTPAKLPSLAERPLFLYTPPRPHPPPRSCQLTPTENLAAEWWEDAAFRKYYIAASPKGEKLWVFFDCKQHQWFLHGTFD